MGGWRGLPEGRTFICDERSEREKVWVGGDIADEIEEERIKRKSREN
jgi:hypothetical protein